MVRIVYHSADFDGHASGAIAKWYFDQRGIDHYLYGYNYGQPFPFEEFSYGDDVFFLDVVYQPNEKVKTFETELGWNVYICDHHKSLIEAGLEPYISGGLIDGKFSGCELTWKYFFPERKMPESIELLGRYDVWDKSDIRTWNNRIHPFQMGFNTLKTIPFHRDAYENTWKKIFTSETSEFVDSIINNGKVILEYQNNINYKTMKWLAQELEFEGYKAIVANSATRSSDQFESVWDENKYDLMIVYSRSKYDIGVSLYTTKNDVDCSAIAKKYGGGGHQQAAGFGAKDVSIKNNSILFVM